MILHVTTASCYKTHSSNETKKFLAQKFQDRKKSDRDIWLFGQEVPVEDMLETSNMYRWVNMIALYLVSQGNHYFRIHDLFQDVSLDLDDEVYIYIMNTKTQMKSYRLYEVYKIRHDSHPVTNYIGNWSLCDGSLNFVEMNKNSRRRDLRVSIPFHIT